MIDEIAGQISEANAVYAIDYRGISVPQAAELRARLHGAGASFRVVKNTLTLRAADQAGAGSLKGLLEGPTALTFVRGDVAAAAKALNDYARETNLMAFKGGLMDGEALDADQLRSIARLPTRDVLHGQLVAMVASPLTGLVRTLNALISGLAVQLGQIAEQGLVGGDAPQAQAAAQAPAASADEPPAPEAPDQEADPEPEPQPVQPDQARGEDQTPEEDA
ncbi:MAG: 50S ribosomal protein L10 [Solirubrobacteraceae bacterium MAG38_C4-C5]|nr:50S ribosomal protein L10 [Candidatus Siliceabacter maunaloa]